MQVFGRTVTVKIKFADSIRLRGAAVSERRWSQQGCLSRRHLVEGAFVWSDRSLDDVAATRQLLDLGFEPVFRGSGQARRTSGGSRQARASDATPAAGAQFRFGNSFQIDHTSAR